MRKNRQEIGQSEFSILALDDDPIMTATLQSYFQGRGYRVDVENDPLAAIERVRANSYDILLLDFLMTPLCGDQVVERIREFDQDLFIILLTGHKSMAPPIRTIRALDIQGYYEKSDRFDQLELLVESCIKSVRQMRLISSYQQSLATMAGAMPGIYSIHELPQICHQILDAAASLWECKGSLLAVWDERDMEYPLYYPLYFRSGDTFASCRGEEPEQLYEQVLVQGAGEGLLCSLIRDARGVCIGLLAVSTPDDDRYKKQLFEIFVRQCAAALENCFLVRKVREGYLELTKALRLMVDAKDIYTRGHSDRVAYFAGLLARALGKDEETCARVRMAGLFHDVGKVAVPDDILLSSGKLTDEEYEVIRKHPECGASILNAIPSLRDIAPIVRSHHERMDGKGYPDGLLPEAIPDEVRMISIADAFDAMTSTRRYRPNMTFEQALEQLVAGKDTQFDGAMVDVFIAMLRRLPEAERTPGDPQPGELFAEEAFR